MATEHIERAGENMTDSEGSWSKKGWRYKNETWRDTWL